MIALDWYLFACGVAAYTIDLEFCVALIAAERCNLVSASD